jgi:membrane protein
MAGRDSVRTWDTIAQKAKVAYGLIDETISEYSRDRGEMVAAALAFYAMLSVAPLIIIAVAIAGAVLGRGAAEQQVIRLMSDAMGAGAANTVHEWVKQASSSSGIASAIGFLLVLFAASRLTTQLRAALNQVWNIDEAQAESFKALVSDYIRRRLFAFCLVVAAGPLLLMVVASRALLTGLSDVLFDSAPFAATIAQVIQLSFSLVLVWLISAVVFKLVPDTHLGWGAVARGALLTSFLFNVGNWLVGLYLGRASVTQTYGAAGSAVVVLLWLYFSGQLFLLGAEFTQVYAKHFGRGLRPEEERELSVIASRSERSAQA